MSQQVHRGGSHVTAYAAYDMPPTQLWSIEFLFEIYDQVTSILRICTFGPHSNSSNTQFWSIPNSWDGPKGQIRTVHDHLVSIQIGEAVMRGCSIEYEVKKCRQQFKSDSFLKDCQTFPLERFHLWLSRYYLCPLLRINLALSHLVLVT